jgi:hypothetical protein
MYVWAGPDALGNKYSNTGTYMKDDDDIVLLHD